MIKRHLLSTYMLKVLCVLGCLLFFSGSSGGFPKKLTKLKLLYSLPAHITFNIWFLNLSSERGTSNGIKFRASKTCIFLQLAVVWCGRGGVRVSASLWCGDLIKQSPEGNRKLTIIWWVWFVAIAKLDNSDATSSSVLIDLCGSVLHHNDRLNFLSRRPGLCWSQQAALTRAKLGGVLKEFLSSLFWGKVRKAEDRLEYFKLWMQSRSSLHLVVPGPMGVA